MCSVSSWDLSFEIPLTTVTTHEARSRAAQDQSAETADHYNGRVYVWIAGLRVCFRAFSHPPLSASIYPRIGHWGVSLGLATPICRVYV